MCSVTCHIYFYLEYGYQYNYNNYFVVIPKFFSVKSFLESLSSFNELFSQGLLFLT